MTTQIVTGGFTNVASTPKFIPFVGQINQFFLRNLTRSGVTSRGVSGSLTSDRIVEAYFNPNTMTSGTALIKQNGTVSGILAPLQNGIAAINGISLFNATNQALGPEIVVNSFTPGTTTVWVTNTAHGFKVGDNVRVYDLTTSPEIGGVVMTVTAVGSTTQFTTLLNSSNSLTSVGKVRKVGNAGFPPPSLYYPEWRAIAAVSLANPMVVTTLVQQNYQVGDVVRFSIPAVFGMQDLNTGTNGLPVQATVSAVNNAVGTQTVTFANVDSSAFTAFAWPSSSSYPFSLPVMIPQGEGNTNSFVVPTPLPYGNQNILGFATQNLGQNGILIGAGDGTNSATTGGVIGSTVDAWEWEIHTSLQTYY